MSPDPPSTRASRALYFMHAHVNTNRTTSNLMASYTRPSILTHNYYVIMRARIIALECHYLHRRPGSTVFGINT